MQDGTENHIMEKYYVLVHLLLKHRERTIMTVITLYFTT